MLTPLARQWAPTLTLLLVTAALSRCGRPWLHDRDFVCTRVLPDGEVERRVHKGRISAIETTVGVGSAVPTPPSPPAAQELQVLTLLQVTDGRHFIQLIYDSGWELRDCEYLRSARSVDEFYQAFAADLDCPRQSRPWNESRTSPPLQPRDATNLTRPEVTDYASLRRECKALHRRIREVSRHQQQQQGLQRLKRDLFLYPGTNWCGSGSNARKFNELGYNAAADRCCRDHDHCPFTIEGFTRKYNFFNFRFHTISHCDCDERFRACLKFSGTAAGNMVGKLFFNVVQTKCFLFKHAKTCAKRSWWGKCLKHDKEKMAVLRDALKY